MGKRVGDTRAEVPLPDYFEVQHGSEPMGGGGSARVGARVDVDALEGVIHRTKRLVALAWIGASVFGSTKVRDENERAL